MAGYLGDILEDATIRGSFNTRTAAGTPITLAGSPTIAVYKDASVTEITLGAAAPTVDFDGRTGLHVFAIDTSASADYTPGSDYRVVLTAGTVDGVSVVGVCVGSFSIENRNTKANVTQMAANVITAAAIADNAITDAKVAADVTIASVTGTVGSVTNAVTVGTINANAITASSIASGAFTSAKFAAGAFDAVWTVTTRSLTTFGSLVSDIWSHATRILTAGTNIVLAKGTGVTGFNDLDAAGVRTAIGLGSANLDAQLADLPTVAEFNARSLPSADYFVVSDYTAPDNAGIAANGVAIGNVPTLAEIEASTVLAKEATVGTRATQTSVDGKPTLAQIEASTVLPTKTDVQNAGLL
jgi:hypothetical protein